MSKKEKDPADIEIGNRLRNFRENTAHETRDAFSSATSLSLQFVYDVEAGNKGLSAKSIKKIVDAYRDYGLTADYLLFGNIDRLPNSLSPLARKKAEANLEETLNILRSNES